LCEQVMQYCMQLVRGGCGPGFGCQVSNGQSTGFLPLLKVGDGLRYINDGSSHPSN
jgi:hypothetical protein